MLADEVDYVIGVDTHRDQHAFAVVTSPAGAVVAQTVLRVNARGYAGAVRFAERHAPGVRAWAVEGAGHYGAGLSRYLGERGETVLEVGRQAIEHSDLALARRTADEVCPCHALNGTRSPVDAIPKSHSSRASPAFSPTPSRRHS